ncbi:class I SAM-dependent methyltransferase [Neobacillus sp. LXY-4]|uniref:class I SAM-dependent methyltransferase n=1 Tax=Neobacillus sp. LXY-4 TaxID=3379826 RepID=UPI003EE0853B
MESIIRFYENSNEDLRLTADNARRIEYILTTKALDRYIKHEDKILELGAGTGIYSLYFAERGCKVIATDLTPKHIEQINQKIIQNKSDQLSIKTKIVNATDLREFQSESFDVVLCLGPMYHLIEESDREKCLQESLRVLKKGGLLAIAYINKYYILHSVMTNDKTYLTKDFINKIMKTGVIREGEKECFWTDAFFTSPNEIEALLNKFDTEIIDHLATDDLSPNIRSFINSLNEEEFNTWMYYIESCCREKSKLGTSNHALLLCKKK